jgi:hypothetical protein
MGGELGAGREAGGTAWGSGRRKWVCTEKVRLMA